MLVINKDGLTLSKAYKKYKEAVEEGIPSHYLKARLPCPLSDTGYHSIELIISSEGDIKFIDTECGLGEHIESLHALGMNDSCSSQARGLLKVLGTDITHVPGWGLAAKVPEVRDIKDPALKGLLTALLERASDIRRYRVELKREKYRIAEKALTKKVRRLLRHKSLSISPKQFDVKYYPTENSFVLRCNYGKLAETRLVNGNSIWVFHRNYQHNLHSETTHRCYCCNRDYTKPTLHTHLESKKHKTKSFNLVNKCTRHLKCDQWYEYIKERK